MIKSISSLLFFSKNLKRTSEFYKALGFKPEIKDSMVSFYVNWFSVNFIDKKHSEFKSGFEGDLGRGMFIYMKVDDVDKFYKFVLKKGIKPASIPRDWPWRNREFVVKDPDGYRLVFFNKIK